MRRTKRLGDVALRWVAVGAIWGWAVAAYATYNPFPLRDPARPWSVSLTTRVGYDDNIRATSSDEEDSLIVVFNPAVAINWPIEQSFLGFRYGYTAVWYEESYLNDWEESHAFDFIISHTFTPRLVLDITDRYRRGVEQEISEVVPGGAVQIRKVGGRDFNTLSGTLAYNLTTRWTLSLGGAWELYRYDDRALDFLERDTYQITASATYLFNPRLFMGLNYRYLETEYRVYDPDAARDSESHLGYVSFVRRFSPLLTWSLNGGVEYREFDNGDTQTAPNINSTLSYAYAKGCAFSVSAYYGISDITAGAGSRVSVGYRTSDNLTVGSQITHAFTPRLRGNLDVIWSHNRYKNPVTPLLSSTSDDTLRIGTTLRYYFTRWLSGDISYSYDRLFVDPSELGYDRNRVTVGLTAVY